MIRFEFFKLKNIMFTVGLGLFIFLSLLLIGINNTGLSGLSFIYATKAEIAEFFKVLRFGFMSSMVISMGVTYFKIILQTR